VCVSCLVRGACEASSLSDVSSWIPGRSAGYHTIVVGTQVGGGLARWNGREQGPVATTLHDTAMLKGIV
jgi:hypothetical protein